jgi:hypothetical protein
LSKLLFESIPARISQLTGRVYVVDVAANLSRSLVAHALDVIWGSPGWRQPWGLVIVMRDSATYDGEIRSIPVPPSEKRAVGTHIVTQKPVQRMVIKSIGLGLSLVGGFALTASSTLEEAVAAQLDLIKRAEERKRAY